MGRSRRLAGLLAQGAEAEGGEQDAPERLGLAHGLALAGEGAEVALELR